MLALFTFWVVLAYAIYARNQWIEMQRAADAASTAANAAKSSADTAYKTLISSQTQFRNQERPWVTADPNPLVPKEISRGQFFIPKQTPQGVVFRPDINIHAINVGKTPAIEMYSALFEFKLGPAKEILEEVKKFVPTYPRGGAGGFLSPNQDVVLPMKERFLTQEEINKLRDGSWSLFVVGGIQYRDVFRPRIASYETVYCFNFHSVGIPVATCGFTNYIK